MVEKNFRRHEATSKGGHNNFCDNQSTIAMTRNPIYHNRTRHIDTRHHFIRELVDKGSIKVEYCSSQEQVADLFTKSLSLDKFIYFRDKLGVVDFLH